MMTLISAAGGNEECQDNYSRKIWGMADHGNVEIPRAMIIRNYLGQRGSWNFLGQW